MATGSVKMDERKDEGADGPATIARDRTRLARITPTRWSMKHPSGPRCTPRVLAGGSNEGPGRGSSIDGLGVRPTVRALAGPTPVHRRPAYQRRNTMASGWPSEADAGGRGFRPTATILGFGPRPPSAGR